MITSLFASLEAVKTFATEDDYTVAVIEPEARGLLTRGETYAQHYEVRESFWSTPLPSSGKE